MNSTTRQIELSQGFYATVDAEDYDALQGFSWFITRPFFSPHLMYAVRKFQLPSGGWSKKLMHREILGAIKGQIIDHKDRDGLNNARSNLRFCTVSQNAANSRQHHDAKHSRFKGVTKHKDSGRWQAQTQFKGRRIYIGMFGREEEAADAYAKAVEKLFGEYARL